MSDRRTTLVGLALALAVGSGLVACSDAEQEQGPTPSPTPAARVTPTPTPPPRAEPVRVPANRACYRLSFGQAVSPTNGADTVPCTAPHTSQTFEIGRVDNVVSGHLLAIDSTRVQQSVAATCPAALGAVVGGTLEDQRLSMLRAVWFTPSLEQAARGASWYRCDVVALAGAEDLMTVRGPLAGVLDTPEGRERYGMCGTASPGVASFVRVPCSAAHTWRAFDVISLDAGRYPGPGAVDEAGAGPCEDAAADVAEDPLDYEWAYEGPDADQWRMGQTFIRCWAPD